MKDSYTKLNDFFVSCFNNILQYEQQWLTKKYGNKLSISEVHLIEAVYLNRESSTSSRVAKHLNITPGSLTVAANTLVRKGYLIKQQDADDKRIIKLLLTESGRNVLKSHNDFHKNMLFDVIETLPTNECEILINALEKINDFFGEKI